MDCGPHAEIVDVVPMRAGDATFHHGWCVHGARPNTSDTMREAMVIAYHPQDMRVGKANNYAKVRNLEAFLDNLPEGSLAAGSTNTLVYSRDAFDSADRSNDSRPAVVRAELPGRRVLPTIRPGRFVFRVQRITDAVFGLRFFADDQQAHRVMRVVQKRVADAGARPGTRRCRPAAEEITHRRSTRPGDRRRRTRTPPRRSRRADS